MDNEWSEGWTCPDCACEGKVAEETPVVERLPSAEAALGSDPEGVLRAEAAARDCAEAMEPWGAGPVPEKVIWRVGGPLSQPMRAAMPHEAGSHIRKLLFHAWGYRGRSDYGPGLSESLRRPGMFLSRAFWHAQLDWLWRLAAGEGHVIPASYQYVGEHRPPERVVGLTLGDLPNPFAPAVDLWATGYVLDKIEPAGIRLIAPY
ncbi:hypothetical protein [Spirillospora sp. CA-294931]|uniref:hypothetical protein n=1 Tax=Spirillospora sp. CA-294931 TaxID=3240042 RepID=UPI003D929F37